METHPEENRRRTEAAWCFEPQLTAPEAEVDQALVVPVLLLSSDAWFVGRARRSLAGAGFTVVATRSPADAVQLTTALRFDAAVIDYDLPQGDGVAVHEEIVALHGESSPPAVMLGERHCEALVTRCAGAGLAGIHVKTDPIERLIIRLTRSLADPDKRRAIESTVGIREHDWDVDPLTGLPSEVCFGRRLLGEAMTADEDGSPLSLLMIGPDRFERIVDRMGRRLADSVLCETARTIRGELRTRDCLACYGDHNLAVILPGTNTDDAIAVGHRLRAALASTEFGTLEQPLAVTFSVGVAGSSPGRRLSPETMCSQALHACAGARSMGGDRVLSDSALTGRPLVLVVSPTAAEADLVVELTACPVEVRATETLGEAWQALKELPVAMLVVPTEAGSAEGAIELLAWCRGRHPSVKRVLAAENVDFALTVLAVNRAGIDHYLSLPVDGPSLPAVVEKLLQSER